MAYLTYAEYQAYGGACKEATFLRFEATARAHINRLTHDRVKAESTVRESVKLLAYEIVDLLVSTEKGSKSGMKSYSNGVQTASYLSEHELRVKIASLARTHLAGESTVDGVKLLYAGVVIP